MAYGIVHLECPRYESDPRRRRIGRPASAIGTAYGTVKEANETARLIVREGMRHAWPGWEPDSEVYRRVV
jgi:hypothetical protein